MNYASDERLDCLIRLALIERAAKDVEAIQAMDTSSVVCPAKVDRRIHRMIARKAKEASTRKMKRVLVRVMVAALIVMSLTLALLLSERRFGKRSLIGATVTLPLALSPMRMRRPNRRNRSRPPLWREHSRRIRNQASPSPALPP